MASLREYYEKDFSHYLRVRIKLTVDEKILEGSILYDFIGYFAFIVLYVPEKDKDETFFIKVLSSLKYGNTKLLLDNVVNLPRAKEFHGHFLIGNTTDFHILADFWGDVEQMSTKDMQSSKRVFIYSETNLSQKEIKKLMTKAKELNHDLRFRSEPYRIERSNRESPLAFISYDSRDREEVVQKIAFGLQRMLCPVWYDQFSLNVGDSLREKIEKGLKECNKCILVLSPSFLSNNGWTKTEFDTIFTRQILEEQKLVLPVWYKVSKQAIYNYCPSLLNIKGLVWQELGEEEVCKQLYRIISG